MGSFVQPTLRIASVSGSVTDRRHGFAELARDEDVQFIVGDYLSEYNMTMRGGSKVQSPLEAAYEPCFLESIRPALPHLAQNHIRVAVNAGGSDTKRLYEDLTDIIRAAGLDLKVAYVEGDEVFSAVEKAIEQGDSMRNLTTGIKTLSPPFDHKALTMGRPADWRLEVQAHVRAMLPRLLRHCGGIQAWCRYCAVRKSS